MVMVKTMKTMLLMMLLAGCSAQTAFVTDDGSQSADGESTAADMTPAAQNDGATGDMIKMCMPMYGACQRTLDCCDLKSGGACGVVQARPDRLVCCQDTGTCQTDDECCQHLADTQRPPSPVVCHNSRCCSLDPATGDCI